MKLAADADLEDLVGSPVGNVMAGKMNGAGDRLELAGYHTDERGLAGAIRAEQNAQLILLDAEIQIVEDRKARNSRGQAFDFEEVSHPFFPFPAFED